MKFITAFLFSISICLIYAQTKKIDNGYAIETIVKTYGDYYNFHSDTMNKDFPVLVFLPDNYKANKRSLPVVYMLHGVNGAPLNEDGIRGLCSPQQGFREAANEYQVIIVCPLVGNKFYLNSPINKADKYATLIAIELVRFVESKFKVIKNRESRILAGFSMGGYGAVSLLCRYPDIFSIALSRAGALDNKSLIEKLYWDDILNKEVLGSYWEYPENHHLNSCLNLLNKVRTRKDVYFVIEVGRDDFLYDSNKKVETRLRELNMAYIYAEYPGGHEWNKYCLNSLLTHLQYFNQTKR